MKELKLVDKFDIIDVFKPKDWYNAAHYAAEYLMLQGCNEIHVWGCDSIFQDTVESTTSEYVTKQTTGDARFIRNWRNVWDKIILNNRDFVHFVVFRIPK